MRPQLTAPCAAGCTRVLLNYPPFRGGRGTKRRRIKQGQRESRPLQDTEPRLTRSRDKTSIPNQGQEAPAHNDVGTGPKSARMSNSDTEQSAIPLGLTGVFQALPDYLSGNEIPRKTGGSLFEDEDGHSTPVGWSQTGRPTDARVGSINTHRPCFQRLMVSPSLWNPELHLLSSLAAPFQSRY